MIFIAINQHLLLPTKNARAWYNWDFSSHRVLLFKPVNNLFHYCMIKVKQANLS